MCGSLVSSHFMCADFDFFYLVRITGIALQLDELKLKVRDALGEALKVGHIISL